MRGLRRGAVRRRHEVRVGHGMAELLRAGRGPERGAARGSKPRDASHRSPLPTLRRASGARVRRRAGAYRHALLHQLVRARPGDAGLAASSSAEWRIRHISKASAVDPQDLSTRGLEPDR